MSAREDERRPPERGAASERVSDLNSMVAPATDIAPLTRGERTELQSPAFFQRIVKARARLSKSQLAAVSYAAGGIPVFPCKPGTKLPATRHGFKDATTDISVVFAWWTAMPEANIATPTGVLWDVLDFDRKPGQVDAVASILPKLNDAGLLFGAVATATTRNGGVHLFYPASGGRSASLHRHSLDFKAVGGYVLLPPSRVPADYPDLPGAYVWDDAPAGRDGTPADWDRIRRRLDPPAPSRPPGQPRAVGDPQALAAVVARARQGNRNRALFWAACRAAEKGTLEAARTALIDAAIAAGLDHREAAATIASAARTEAGAR